MTVMNHFGGTFISITGNNNTFGLNILLLSLVHELAGQLFGHFL